MAACSRILAWEIPWTEEHGRLQFMGSQTVRHDLAIKQLLVSDMSFILVLYLTCFLWYLSSYIRTYWGTIYMVYFTLLGDLRWVGSTDSSVGKESTCNAGDLGSIRFVGERISYPLQYSWASFGAQLVKTLPAIQETWVPGLGRCPGEGEVYPLQYSDLENSMDCLVHGITKSWAWLGDFHLFGDFSVVLVVKNLPASVGDKELQVRFLVAPWRRQPTPVFLPGESPWTEELCGLWSIGSTKSQTQLKWLSTSDE